ncbi:hypothetical protein KXD40_007231 [Peronospora effusa]|uniref:Uncharacterized protein n=1 Tax=Peronospora effusa TaxID=542832 RepID=A0A3M6V9I5_9STRA|nr:hypothetical protein DD238_007399 [Peronospora effusa]RQM12344.1 hypothetical protein DD237_007677 [Peronospora effusa]UIZ28767.1 hypothetical protein KXD40_007231 [Peronospora effusa]
MPDVLFAAGGSNGLEVDRFTDAEMQAVAGALCRRWYEKPKASLLVTLLTPSCAEPSTGA